MALYESVFIARQDISSTQAEQLADQFTEIITGNGGEVKQREIWGLRNLAYRIKKNRKGHYIMFHIDAPSDAVQEMERNMRINEDVLRYMTIRMDELPEGPSVMMQVRSERPDRGGRRGGPGGGPGGGRFGDGPPRGRRDEERKSDAPSDDAPASKSEDTPTEAKTGGDE
ncbi:MAG: 30S ribosomal protein S6 [Rhodospirillaceae bacterium]|jgi:small subunit ribosomal protein S6|nr:30S ribosomal protein S6 [Rhodospirillaceae bacterium]MBT6136789.1 30S ribosomal protein S6 [Rhodospirillaceae bacterium]